MLAVPKTLRLKLRDNSWSERERAAPEVLGFRLGTLDSDPSRPAEVHFMVGSKAPWVEINDDLPQGPGGVPFGVRD